MDFSNDASGDEAFYRWHNLSSPSGAFYEVPNHFPTLSKGCPQWSPWHFKPTIPKSFQIPLTQPISPVINTLIKSSKFANKGFDSKSRRISTPKSNDIHIHTNSNLIHSKSNLKDEENLKHKAKLIVLCDDLDLSVRRVPSFRITGIPTPTHRRSKVVKVMSPLRGQEGSPHERTLTSMARRKKRLRVSIDIEKKPKKSVRELMLTHIWERINESNGVKTVKDNSKCFKVYVGSGNNCGLIIRTARNRPWWCLTDNKKEANLIWTSCKPRKTLSRLQIGDEISPTVNSMKFPAKVSEISDNFGFGLIINSPHFKLLQTSHLYSSQLILCNKLEENEHICSKKLMFINLKAYCDLNYIEIFDIVPMTFHITSLTDTAFKDFERLYKLNETTGADNNIWIIKPGEDTNRGIGISISSNLTEIKSLISEKISQHTCILQKYIEKPLLINKRKFDIRCFALLTSINANIQGYFYKEGYIRTSSKEFSIKNLENRYVHLTNDAVQKNSEDYGKFEAGNKMSYNDLQLYLSANYPKSSINFESDILPKIKDMIIHTFKASYNKIDPLKRLHSFELIGYDFMVDENFKVWLIEANTNPCLETSCAFLSRIIPACIDNVFRVVVDPLFQPPVETSKARSWVEDGKIENKFELIFNEVEEKCYQ